MRLIDDFYCIENEIEGNGNEKVLSEGICKIKSELIRPEILLLLNGNKIKFKYNFSATLNENSFSQEELLFFEKTYNVKLTPNKIYPSRLTTDNSFVNKLYDLPATIALFEDTESNKNYLLIEFRRWQYDYQPRGAGEDSLGEDITYVHGIWEDPFLTDEIRIKIKGIADKL
ncbi:hypothetical protein ASF10_09275 [Flavobacterium sp. Leaf82]|uniref:hypothetical protein n=1 Tax=unclassified Flavobacterium TaxID=196869 RepID=UPI0006F1ECEC|nr:hypothetical protein [Flavobacterium sp. Leaf82]KQO22551.1 hypothetical protein ASF10_09275 [Flavobacterium sp. Leaf82]